MKRLIPFVAFAFIITLVACNSAPRVSEIETRIKKYQDSVKFASDTVGLAEFQAWKAQNEIVDANQYNNGAAAVAPAVASRPRSYAPVRRASSGTRSVSRSSGSRTSESGHTAQASKKRGWSKAAKGTAIGAAGGAVAGAVINKRNRVVGGVVGGVLGGAVGYGIGRGMDKRDGRY